MGVCRPYFRAVFIFCCCALFLAAAVVIATVTPVCAAPVSFVAEGGAGDAVPVIRQSHLLQTINDSAGIGAGAQKFVQAMADRGIGFLGDQALSMESKKASFRKLLKESFDMKTIGRFSLGRYWRVATPQQRTEYQKLFENMVIEVYARRFSDYQGQSFEARSFRSEGDKDTLVTSFIVPAEGPEIQVDWRIRYKDGVYKVVDIIVEGVSMSVTQRSDFSSVIQRGGGDVAVLIEHLRAM